MGTRSLTYVYSGSDADAITCMYRQFDGYPSGHGKELADFLAPITMINGISSGAKAGTHANGPECLAAQMVKHFKEEIGGIYLHNPSITDAGQDYEYKVRADTSGITVEVYACQWKADAKQLFQGSPHQLLEWIDAGADEGED